MQSAKMEKDAAKECAAYTDEEWLSRLRDGDPEAADYLSEKYKSLVRALADRYYLEGADKEDLVQEGMIGLFKAMRDYRADKGAGFYSFAVLCIRRSMYTAMEKYHSSGNRPLNEYVSLSAEKSGNAADVDGGKTLLDSLESDRGMNPEQIVLDRDFLSDFAQQSTEHLSQTEYRVMNLLLEGKSYLEIADILAISPKSADNAIQRCRQKLKKIIGKM